MRRSFRGRKKSILVALLAFSIVIASVSTCLAISFGFSPKQSRTSLSDLQSQSNELRGIITELNQKIRDYESRAEKLLDGGSCDDTNEIETLLKEKESIREQRDELQKQQDKILADIMAQSGGSGLRSGDPSKGGYPYSDQCPAAKINHAQYPDKWGMYICECVSYVAWKVEQNYGHMPYWGSRGNANQWLNNARAAGYKVTSVPKPGAVGISLGGPWGHAVWVEYVSGNRVHISQYDYRINGVPGTYSEMDVNASAYTYIYFDERDDSNDVNPAKSMLQAESHLEVSGRGATDVIANTPDPAAKEEERNYNAELEALRLQCKVPDFVMPETGSANALVEELDSGQRENITNPATFDNLGAVFTAATIGIIVTFALAKKLISRR